MPEKAQKLQKQNRDEFIIDYTTYCIDTISIKNLTSDYSQWLKDKVVFIGDMQDLSDAHLTPLHGVKPGVIIHAFELQTILNENYIETTKAWLNWLIAIFICSIYVSLLLFSKYHMVGYGSLVLRIGQFLLIFLLIYIGSAVFQSSHVYVDFAPAVLMIGLGSLAFDLGIGTFTIIKIIKNKYHKK